MTDVPGFCLDLMHGSHRCAKSGLNPARDKVLQEIRYVMPMMLLSPSVEQGYDCLVVYSVHVDRLLHPASLQPNHTPNDDWRTRLVKNNNKPTNGNWRRLGNSLRKLSRTGNRTNGLNPTIRNGIDKSRGTSPLGRQRPI